MSQALQNKHYYTEEEYLALEEKADARSEYWQGEIFLMAGASRQHNLISLHVAGAMNTAFVGRPYEAYAANMRVAVEAQEFYTYPDVIAVCGEPQFSPKSETTLVNPTVLVEVQTELSQPNDLRSNFHAYRDIASLQDYILIDQSRVAVEHYHKVSEDTWHIRIYSDRSAVISIESIGFEISLERIYDKVVFPPPKTKK